MNLTKYILKRILISIFILFITLTITFFVGRVFPGDPFLAVFGRGSEAEYELYHHLIEFHGLDDPLIIQYKNYLVNLFSGDWGHSWMGYQSDGPLVKDLVAFTFPISLEIIIPASLFAYFLGKRIGIFTATRKNKLSSNLVRIITIAGAGVPNFILGTLLLLIVQKSSTAELIIGIKTFSFPDPPRVTGFRLLDCLIAGDSTLFFDSAIHYLWPILILGIQFAVLFARQTRSNMLEVLQEKYIRTARAKGCNEKQIIKKHAYRVAMIPNIAYIGILFPVMISNLILVENIFGIPGFGTLLFNSFNFLDYNLQLICISICVIAIILMNLITDVLYSILDPRIIYD